MSGTKIKVTVDARGAENVRNFREKGGPRNFWVAVDSQGETCRGGVSGVSKKYFQKNSAAKWYVKQ